MIERTSDPTWDYNCIAHAAQETDRWWWPDPMGQGHWPDGVAREETLEAFEAAYATLDYVPCADGTLEVGYEKIVLYSIGAKPTHAARQITTGEHAGHWTSKLGREIDVRHESPQSLVLELAELLREYGEPTRYLRRPI